MAIATIVKVGEEYVTVSFGLSEIKDMEIRKSDLTGKPPKKGKRVDIQFGGITIKEAKVL
ncbi:hypothetical protein GF360_03890 [candidate division WWE3 bacterium]|nr:hypothetical protein [candidate division WWE3 bacterium]